MNLIKQITIYLLTEVVSYGKDLFDVVLELRIDGQYKTSTVIEKLEAGIVSTYVWRLNDVNQDTYDYASVGIVDIEDNFMFDNTLEFYSDTQNFRIQIVDHNVPEAIDSTKEFITKALQALNRNYTIRQVSNPDNIHTEGYDLYIYSENVPTTLPIDGAVWIFNPKTLPATTGSVGSEVSVDNIAPTAETSSGLYQQLMQMVTPSKMTISKYKRITPSSDFDVLMSHQGDPLLMVSTNSGVKTTLFSFGLSNTNLPLLFIDLPMLVKNLSDYSMIETIESQVIDAGQTININPHPAALAVDIEYGDISYSYGNESIEFELNNLGTYRITQTLNSGVIKTTDFFVRVPAIESNFDYKGEVIYMPLIPSTPGGDEVTNDLLNLLPYLAGFLLLLIAIEWGYNTVNNISISFVYPWLLFIVIPLVLLAIWPYFKLPVKYRNSRNRITSMVLHLIVVVLLVIVLSGMKIHNNYVSRKSDIIVLIDQSTSQMDNQEAIQNFLEDVVEQLPSDYNIGIMEFGQDTIYVAQMGRNKAAVLLNYTNNKLQANRAATNIEQALLYAQNQLDNKVDGRIILVSDGRQTDGHATIAAKALADSGTRVDVKYIQPKSYQMDAQISRLVLPQNPVRGMSTVMNVVIDSVTTGLADLNISYTNSEGVLISDTQEVMLNPGTLTYSFEHVFVDYGLTEVKVELDFDDTIIENNVYYGFVYITNESSQGILIIEG